MSGIKPFLQNLPKLFEGSATFSQERALEGKSEKDLDINFPGLSIYTEDKGKGKGKWKGKGKEREKGNDKETDKEREKEKGEQKKEHFLSYAQWNKENPDVWVKLANRDEEIIRANCRHLIRKMIRAFALELKKDPKGKGEVVGIRIYERYVEIDLQSGNNRLLKDQFLRLMHLLLKKNAHYKEVDYFFTWISDATCDTFWLLEHAPLLKSIQERVFFPNDLFIGFERISWRAPFTQHMVGDDFLENHNDMSLWTKIKDHPGLKAVYEYKSERDTEYSSDYLGLLLFAKAVLTHAYDHSSEFTEKGIEALHEIESNFANLFPEFLSVIFDFLFTEHNSLNRFVGFFDFLRENRLD